MMESICAGRWYSIFGSVDFNLVALSFLDDATLVQARQKLAALDQLIRRSEDSLVPISEEEDTECHGYPTDKVVCQEKRVDPETYTWSDGHGLVDNIGPDHAWELDHNNCPRDAKPIEDLITIVTLVKGYDPQGTL